MTTCARLSCPSRRSKLRVGYMRHISSMISGYDVPLSDLWIETANFDSYEVYFAKRTGVVAGRRAGACCVTGHESIVTQRSHLIRLPKTAHRRESCSSTCSSEQSVCYFSTYDFLLRYFFCVRRLREDSLSNTKASNHVALTWLSDTRFVPHKLLNS